jgi:hypothetical protein
MIQLKQRQVGKPVPEDRIKFFYYDSEPDLNDPNLISELERYHNKHTDINCRAYKLLGIYLDENKLNKPLYCINRAKNLLKNKSLTTLDLHSSTLTSHIAPLSQAVHPPQISTESLKQKNQFAE